MADLFFDLAFALDAHGFPSLLQELELGGQAKLDKVLLHILRHEEILIIVDEFQRLLPKDKSSPPQVWAKLVEDLNNSSHSKGRLLLISNRFIKPERWSENCHVEELQGLSDQEAEDLFTELLQVQGLEARVPSHRRREIAHRLGGNPRALKTLVFGLRTETLDELLSAAPDLLTPGDVILDPGLLEDFEREVLERALPKLEYDLLKFMRWLSVHRRPFKKEALQHFTGGREAPDVLRKQLFDRFLLEQSAGGDVLHPLAREISVTRLRTENREWKQAHSLAADYYFRYFKAQRLVGESNLATSYTELRHHLYESGRIGELHEASEKLTRYAISQIGLTTPVPANNKESLEARISLISAIPDDRRPKVLQYHLARCLLKRDADDDKKLALEYVRKATGRNSHSAVWILQINLEYELNGLEAALMVINEGLENVKPDDDDARVIYVSGAELLAKADRIDEAIKLIEKGIELIPPNKNLYLLYQTAIELTWKSNNSRKTESLVMKGLVDIPKAYGRNLFVETTLRLLKARHDTEAINRLLSEVGPRQLDPSERANANYALRFLSGDWEGAAEIARQAHLEFPFYAHFLTKEVDARLALGRIQTADTLMKSYEIRGSQVRDNPVVWLKAYVSLIAGRSEEAKSISALYTPDNFDANRILDEMEMLRLWSVGRGGFNEPLEDNFPGVVEYRRRIADSQEIEITEPGHALKTSEPKRILVVATEWNSRHGGLSTFNRSLCIALAEAGANVVCYVPEASAEEKRRAREDNVEIVEAAGMPGRTIDSLLAAPVELPPGFVPNVIIGHDRITGDASVHLATHAYPGSTRVLFIHTSPEEIEWHKEPREDSDSVLRAAERKRHQLKLAEGCDLVVTVGPRLTTEFQTDLIGAGNPAPVMELTPGLPKYSLTSDAPILPPSIRCLVLGRVEDYQLKGLDLAAKAFGQVVANWRAENPPRLVVRGAPVGTGDELRQRLIADSSPAELDIIIRHYSADETEIRNDLREASLVLMPSRKEGFGLVGLEAISFGIPTIISDQSGLAETIRRHAPLLANEWILPVTGENSVMKWAERIEYFITGREGAFARAAVLREKLALELDWRQAVGDLLERLILQKTDG
jgi:glycosyltransferase involved in cell wall biosynthesis/tetratricopeptide (TPR) repeat protein